MPVRNCLTAAGGTVLIVVLLVWVFLFKVSNRPFDPVLLAGSEVRLWKAYYARDPLELHGEMVLMLHNQFGLSRYRTWQVSTRLTMASMNFAASSGPVGGEKREAIVRGIAAAYTAIKEAKGLEFDPRQAAEAEFAWWVARRTVGQDSEAQVGRKIEDLYATLYGSRNDHIREAALLRARAARLRDTTSDWPEVERLLVASYRELLRGIGA